jgi:hypothetical protein
MVEVRPPGKGERVKGELLAVGADRLWVLAPEGRGRGIPFDAIEEVRVRRHGLDGKTAGAWATIGAVATGAALAGACGSVEGAGGCGGFFLLTAGIWALFGGPAAHGLGKSSELRVSAPNFAMLRPYARFPQGLPQGVEPASLGLDGGGEAPKKGDGADVEVVRSSP